MIPETFAPDTTDQIEIIRELGELGIKPEWLQDIGMNALAAYNQTTLNDAINAAGSYAYFSALRSTRDILCPKGWLRQVQNNLEMTVNPETNMSIIVASGDKNTGIINGVPKTKNPKGNQTKRVVDINNRQLRLPTMEHKIQVIPLGKTWIFLFHVDIKRSQMRFELSLPIKMDLDDLHVSGWQKRIIGTSIEFDHTPTAPKAHDALLQEFTVELKRKSNG